MTTQCTIVIGEFSVAQANALSDGIFLSAVPPLTAWVGFATALGLRLGESIKINGIAPVIGEAHLHRGHAKYVRYRAGQLSDVSSRGVQHPTIDDRRTSLNAYLLLDVTSEEEIQQTDIEQALIGLRLAGGVIQPVSGRERINIKTFEDDQDYTGLEKSLRYLPSYFYLLEDACHLVKLAKEQPDGLQGFDILTAPMRRWTDEESKDELKLPERPDWLPSQGYYRPMAVGYQLLEEPQQRLGVRESINGPARHAFAEPVFTLIRFRTVASIRKTHSPRHDGSYFWLQGERVGQVLGACPMPMA
ncbi:MAG: type I-F CRISPR-associated protein Csy2 [Methylococcales bacterium]|nr:type I-F CRISPR-associated protein Csy2 [Methylococcales bacterium]